MIHARTSQAFERQVRQDSTSPSGHVRTIPRASGRPGVLRLLPFGSAAIGVAAVVEAGTWFGAGDIEAGSGLAAVASIIGVALLIVAALEPILVYGLWKLHGWAWPLGLALTATALALTLLTAGRGSSTAHTMSLLVEIGTLWYLLSTPVQEALRGDAGHDD